MVAVDGYYLAGSEPGVNLADKVGETGGGVGSGRLGSGSGPNGTGPVRPVSVLSALSGVTICGR